MIYECMYINVSVCAYKTDVLKLPKLYRHCSKKALYMYVCVNAYNMHVCMSSRQTTNGT